MQLPDQLLAADIPSFCKTVLAALWRDADGDTPWTAVTPSDLVEVTGLSPRHVDRAIAILKDRGGIRRETRKVAGRPWLGFGLSRALLPLQRRPPRARATTRAGAGRRVVKRDKSHTPRTTHDDLLAITRVAGRGDSETRIAEALLRHREPCSDGAWHPIKVHRRVKLMRQELGMTGKDSGLRAGDVVARWKRVAEAQAKRETAPRSIPDARIDHSGETHHDLADEPAPPPKATRAPRAR